MAAPHLVPQDVDLRYEVHQWRNGLAILSTAHPDEWKDILAVLRGFRLLKSDIVTPGGRKSRVATKIDSALYARGWREKSFDTRIVVDDVEHIAPTHRVDCFKNRVALEVEWNNKDPFYDRDLTNFRLLFELRTLDVGIVITRCDELQSIFDRLGRGASYGASTTHMSKLLPRLAGGGGGGCPIVAFGIRATSYSEQD